MIVVHQFRDGLIGRGEVGQVEAHGARGSTGFLNACDDGLGPFDAAVGMHQNLKPLGGKAFANGCADGAAAAGDECAFHDVPFIDSFPVASGVMPIVSTCGDT